MTAFANFLRTVWASTALLTAAVALQSAEVAPTQASSDPKTQARGAELPEGHTRGKPLSPPSATDAKIARLTAQILESSHYSQLKLDDAMASKFLDRYLDTLDNQRIHFLASDVAEFDIFRSRLDNLTKGGDVRPSHVIFERFLERLQQRVDYVNELLQNET